MRASHLLAAVAVALILALAGCGGGGGGGGGGSVILTADVTGRVLNDAGTGIDGAIVSAEVSRAIVSAVTSGGGYYTLPDIPTQTGFTLTVNALGTTLVYQNIQVPAADTNGYSFMDVVFTTETPPPAGGGINPTVTIEPADTDVSVGTSPSFRVRLDLGGGVYLEGYHAVWTVSGATGQTVNGTDFVLTPGPVGTDIDLRATVLLNRDTGETVSVQRTLRVVSGTGGDDPPPPPPSG